MVVGERGVGVDEFFGSVESKREEDRERMIRNYEHLEERLKDREGEKVLVVRRRLGRGGPGDSVFGTWDVDSEKQLGVFRGVYLDECENVEDCGIGYTRSHCIVFDMDKHVLSRRRNIGQRMRFGNEWGLEEGPIKIPVNAFQYHGGFVPPPLIQASLWDYGRNPPRTYVGSLDFFVGDERIWEFFKVGETMFYQEYYGTFEDGPITTYDMKDDRLNLNKELRRVLFSDRSYVQAYELLGLGAPDLEEFRRR